MLGHIMLHMDDPFLETTSCCCCRRAPTPSPSPSATGAFAALPLLLPSEAVRRTHVTFSAELASLSTLAVVCRVGEAGCFK